MMTVKMQSTQPDQRIELLWNAFLLFLLVNVVLRVSPANASHQLRSVVDKGRDGDDRDLQVKILPPTNDDCPGALIIPSSFPGDTYTTKDVVIDAATNSTGPPFHKCFISGRTKDVWFKFTPSATNTYGFSTSLGDTQLAIFASYAYSAFTCQNIGKLACRVARPSFDLKMYANFTYLLSVQPAWANVTGSLKLILQRRRPPSNNQCTNATVIDPTVKSFFTVSDSANAILDKTAVFVSRGTSRCDSDFYDTPSFWYKFQNPLTTPLLVDAAVTSRRYGKIAIIKGASCGALQCVDGLKENYVDAFTRSFDFLAEPGTTYYVLFTTSSPYPFNVTIKGQTQFFSVIDSTNDKVLQLLRDNIHYSQIESSSMYLNLQARFLISPQSIKSVRLTYDNPKRNVCDQKAPYAVFGDVNGDYNNATMALGRHRVTATPYSLPNCTGTAGTSIAQDFRVTGCETTFTLSFDAAGQNVGLRPYTSEYLSNRIYTEIYGRRHTKLPVLLSMKCKVNLRTSSGCHFSYLSMMRTELRNATTGELIVSKDYIPLQSARYQFYDVFSDRHVPAGSYSLRAFVNGVAHPAMNFTIVNTTCD